MTVPPDMSDIECIKIKGELVPLYKCPFCNLRDIDDDKIRDHIRNSNHAKHWGVDVDKLHKSEFYVSISKARKSRYRYESKEEYGLPWIKCLFCPYEDNVRSDLEWHMSDHHKKRLYQMKLSPDEPSDMEYRINKAVWLTIRKYGNPFDESFENWR